jgi:hypothetical protein
MSGKSKQKQASSGLSATPNITIPLPVAPSATAAPDVVSSTNKPPSVAKANKDDSLSTNKIPGMKRGAHDILSSESDQGLEKRPNNNTSLNSENNTTASVLVLVDTKEQQKKQDNKPMDLTADADSDSFVSGVMDSNNHSSSSGSKSLHPVSVKSEHNGKVSAKFANIDWTISVTSTLLLFISTANSSGIHNLAVSKGKNTLWTEVADNMQNNYPNMHKRCDITSSKCNARFDVLKGQFKLYTSLTQEFEGKTGNGDVPDDDWWIEVLSRNPEAKFLRNDLTNAIEFEFEDDMELCLGGKTNASKVVVANKAISGINAAKKSSQYFGLSNSNTNSNSNASAYDDCCDEEGHLDMDSDTNDATNAKDAKSLRARKASRSSKASNSVSKPMDESDAEGSKYSRKGHSTTASAIVTLAQSLSTFVGGSQTSGNSGKTTAALAAPSVTSADKKVSILLQINEAFAAKRVFEDAQLGFQQTKKIQTCLRSLTVEDMSDFLTFVNISKPSNILDELSKMVPE